MIGLDYAHIGIRHQRATRRRALARLVLGEAAATLGLLVLLGMAFLLLMLERV